MYTILKHLHQNIETYPGSKKSLHWSTIGKVLHVGKNVNNAKHWQTSLVSPKYSWRARGRCDGINILQISPSFKLENSIFSTKTDTKFISKYKHLFFLKTGNLIINWVSLFCKHTVPEEQFLQTSKTWIWGDLKYRNYSTR